MLDIIIWRLVEYILECRLTVFADFSCKLVAEFFAWRWLWKHVQSFSERYHGSLKIQVRIPGPSVWLNLVYRKSLRYSGGKCYVFHLAIENCQKWPRYGLQKFNLFSCTPYLGWTPQKGWIWSPQLPMHSSSITQCCFVLAAFYPAPVFTSLPKTALSVFFRGNTIQQIYNAVSIDYWR